jgi:hypothetical protein
LTACVSADPTLVARAVEATLSAVPTATPIVVVVTAAGGLPITTVTADVSAQQTLSAATLTLAASLTAPVPMPTGTPAPPASPSTGAVTAPLPIPTGTPTPGFVGPPNFVGNNLFADDFTQPQLWPASEDSTQRIVVAGGQLSITLKAADRFTLVYNIKRRAKDYYVSVTGTASACRFRDRYGLLFRLQGPSDYYQLEVDCDARYRLAKIISGTLTALQDWTPNPAIVKGSHAQNVLGLRVQGDTLEAFVNGVSLGQLKDATFTEGGFGLYAGSGLSESYTAAFDDLQVWELKP